jgi:hypothetical protein
MRFLLHIMLYAWLCLALVSAVVISTVAMWL